jgi:hypothetical protein
MTTLSTLLTGSVLAAGDVPVARLVASPSNGIVGSVVRIDARNSTTTSDAALTYTYTFSSYPIGSQVAAEGFRNIESDGSVVSFSPDIVGTYEVMLVVSNGVHSSAPVFTSVSIRSILVPHGRTIVPDGKFIWTYLRDVWSQVENKEWFETLWSALIQIVGTEMLKLYQTDFNKSIRDIQDLYQRRWLKYEPKLSLDDTDLTFFLGLQSAGTSCSTHVRGLVGEAVILTDPSSPSSASELLLVSGALLSNVSGKTLAITYDPLHSANVGDYTIVGTNAAKTGYKITPKSGGVLPDPTADHLIAGVTVFFDTQATEWELYFSNGDPLPQAGDVLFFRSGPNSGIYRILQVLTTSSTHAQVLVDRPPVSTSDTTGPLVDLYRPIAINLDVEDQTLGDSLTLPYTGLDNDPSNLSPGRVIVAGGQTYTVIRTLADPLQPVPVSVVVADKAIVPTGLAGLTWRIPHTLISKSLNFDDLGVSPGDLLQVDVISSKTTTHSTINAQVVGVDRNRLGFVLSTSALIAGSVPDVDSDSYLTLSSDFGISSVSVQQNGDLSFTSDAASQLDVLNSLAFSREYFNTELSSSTEFVVGDTAYTLHPRAIIRNRTIPVDVDLKSIPLLQEYIKQPDISEHDGKVFLLRNGQEFEIPRVPLVLNENSDFIIDEDKAFDGFLIFNSGTDILYSEDGDFIDRHIQPGDTLTIKTPIDIAGDYIISAVPTVSKLKLSRPIPVSVQGNPINARITITRKKNGKFLRFAPGVFTASKSAPERMWAEVSMFDNSAAVENNFGILVGLTRDQLEAATSSINYRQAVAGLMYAYTNGSAVDKVRLGAQILLGLPFAEHRGIIRSIENDYRLDLSGNAVLGRILVEDVDASGQPQGTLRVYTYPIDPASDLAGVDTNPNTGTAYVVGDIVEEFAPLSKGVEVNDYINSDAFQNAQPDKQLQQFHSIVVRANDNIFTPEELSLVSSFLQKITPSYIAVYLTITSEFDDSPSVDDSITLRFFTPGGNTLSDNVSMSLDSALEMGSSTFDGKSQIYWDGSVYWVRRIGKDLSTTVSSTTITSAAGGFLNHRLNEAFESPLTRAGDTLFIVGGANNGSYAISAVGSDTQLTASGTFATASNQRFAIGRKVASKLRSGTLTTTSGSRILVLEAGALQTDGVAPGDWICFNNRRFLLTRVGPTPAFTDPFGLGSQVAVPLGSVEVSEAATSSGTFDYVIVRPHLLEYLSVLPFLISVAGAGGPTGLSYVDQTAPTSIGLPPIQVSQYQGSYDNQNAGKQLFLKSNGGFVLLPDATMVAVTPPATTVSGYNWYSASGCTLDATKALVLIPYSSDGTNTTFKTYYFNWTTYAFTEVTAPPTTLSNGYDAPICCPMSDGRIFIIYGIAPSQACYFFDPAGNSGNGSWTATGSYPGSYSAGHALVQLNDGRILEPGMGMTFGTGSALFNPSTGTWSTITSFPDLSYYSDLRVSMIKLHSGKVALGMSMGSLSWFDPTTNTWTDDPGGGWNQGHYYNEEWMVEYEPDKLFIHGSMTGQGIVALYDLATHVWTDETFGTTSGIPSHSWPHAENGGWRSAGKWYGISTGTTTAQEEFSWLTVPPNNLVTLTDGTIPGQVEIGDFLEPTVSDGQRYMVLAPRMSTAGQMYVTPPMPTSVTEVNVVRDGRGTPFVWDHAELYAPLDQVSAGIISSAMTATETSGSNSVSISSFTNLQAGSQNTVNGTGINSTTDNSWNGGGISQYTTNLDNQTASKILFVSVDRTTNKSVVVNPDNTFNIISNPESLTDLTDGSGCPIDATKAFYVCPRVNSTGVPYKRAYTFNWSTLTFTRVADPPFVPTVTSYIAPALNLGNGTILVVWSDFVGGTFTSKSYLYNITANTWAATTGNPVSAMQQLTFLPNVLLPNGKALVDFQVYDPTAGTWAANGNTPTNKAYSTYATYILLHSGKVAFIRRSAGGFYGISLYDPSTNLWTDQPVSTNTTGFRWILEYQQNKLFVMTSGSSNKLLFDIGTGTWSSFAFTDDEFFGAWHNTNKFIGYSGFHFYEITVSTTSPSTFLPSIRPGDLFQFVSGPNSSVDVGYGPGLYPISSVGTNAVNLCENLANSSSGDTYKILRRR